MVTLNWTASTDTVDGYNVYRGSAPGQESLKLNTSLIVGTSFVDTKPVVGKDYYVARSVLGGIESANSIEVFAVVPPAPPTGLTATVS